MLQNLRFRRVHQVLNPIVHKSVAKKRTLLLPSRIRSCISNNGEATTAATCLGIDEQIGRCFISECSGDKKTSCACKVHKMHVFYKLPKIKVGPAGPVWANALHPAKIKLAARDREDFAGQILICVRANILGVFNVSGMEIAHQVQIIFFQEES